MAADGYGMDAVTTRLDQATTTLGRAQVRMAFAMRRAEYWRDEFAGHDLPGLGASCEQIRDAAETVHDQAGSLIDQIGEQSATAATVTDTTEPEQVITTLTPVEGELRTLSAHCRAGTNRCADLAALIARNLAGGQPEWLLEQAGAAESAFDATRHHIDTATTYVQAAITYAHQAGTDDNPKPLVPHVEESEAYQGMPLPTHEERAGYRVVNEEPENETAWANFRKRNVRSSGDVQDAVTNAMQNLEAGWNVRPTGQYVCTPTGPAVEPAPQAAAWSDTMTGIVAAAAMVGEGIRMTMRNWRKRKQRKDTHGAH